MLVTVNEWDSVVASRMLSRLALDDSAGGHAPGTPDSLATPFLESERKFVSFDDWIADLTITLRTLQPPTH